MSFCNSTGKNPRIENSNLPRTCIRYFFPKRKCFVFDRPTSDKNLLAHIEEVPEDQLGSNFKKQSIQFCNYIFTCGKTKTLRHGIIVTGNSELLLCQSMFLGVCDKDDSSVGISIIMFASISEYKGGGNLLLH